MSGLISVLQTIVDYCSKGHVLDAKLHNKYAAQMELLHTSALEAAPRSVGTPYPQVCIHTGKSILAQESHEC